MNAQSQCTTKFQINYSNVQRFGIFSFIIFVTHGNLNAFNKMQRSLIQNHRFCTWIEVSLIQWRERKQKSVFLTVTTIGAKQVEIFFFRFCGLFVDYEFLDVTASDCLRKKDSIQNDTNVFKYYALNERI